MKDKKQKLIIKIVTLAIVIFILLISCLFTKFDLY